MSTSDQVKDTELRVVCPQCAHVNMPSEGPRCAECWVRLRAAQPVPLTEVAAQVARVVARRRRQRMKRWVTYGVAVAALVLFTLHNALGPKFWVPRATSDLASTSAANEWAMLGYDAARTSYVPGPAPRPQGKVRWRFETAAPFLAAPTVARGSVFVATADGRIAALDEATGSVQWERQVSGPVDSTPAVAGDTVYVGLRDGSLLALDRRTGDVRWTFNAKGPIMSSPVVYDGAVVFGSGDSQVYSVDAQTGRGLWVSPSKDWVVSAPSVSGEVVAVGGLDGLVLLLDRTSGKLRLNFDIANPAQGSAVIHDGKVYVASQAGWVWAIDLHEREVPLDRAVNQTWFQLWLWGMAGEPPLPRGFVWAYRDRRAQMTSGPAVAGNRVLVGDIAGVLRALDTGDGHEVWRFKTAGAIRATPAVAGDTVYVADASGKLYGLDLSSGQEVFSTTGGKDTATSPVYAAGVVYVASGDGVLYAIE